MEKREFSKCVLLAAAQMPKHRDALCKLDTDIGDGDHGVTVERGFSAVAERFAGDPGADETFAFYREMGDVLSTSMGGAIGPIYGFFFQGIGAGLEQGADVDAELLSKGMDAGLSKIMRIAKVKPGDKTIVDAMLPACEALKAARNQSLADALRAACEAAEQGAVATIPMRAMKGRARFLQERSIGYRDAGASSFTLFLEALRDAVIEREGGGSSLGNENEKNTQ